MKEYSYKEARNKIADGDLVAVRAAHGVLGYLTKFFTRSQYTHTGLAIWDEDGLYLAELNGGRNHKIPMSQLEHIDFDVYEKPHGLRNIRSAITKWLRKPIDYGYLAFFAIGLLNWLKVKMFVPWRKILVCSGWCVAVYEEAGWPRRSRVISPQELTEELELKLQVRV